MTKLEMTVYEKNDLLRILYDAKNYYLKDKRYSKDLAYLQQKIEVIDRVTKKLNGECLNIDTEIALGKNTLTNMELY